MLYAKVGQYQRCDEEDDHQRIAQEFIIYHYLDEKGQHGEQHQEE